MPYRYRSADDEAIQEAILSVPFVTLAQAAILQATQPIWYELNRAAIEQWLASDEGAE